MSHANPLILYRHPELDSRSHGEWGSACHPGLDSGSNLDLKHSKFMDIQCA